MFLIGDIVEVKNPRIAKRFLKRYIVVGIDESADGVGLIRDTPLNRQFSNFQPIDATKMVWYPIEQLKYISSI